MQANIQQFIERFNVSCFVFIPCLEKSPKSWGISPSQSLSPPQTPNPNSKLWVFNRIKIKIPLLWNCIGRLNPKITFPSVKFLIKLKIKNQLICSRLWQNYARQFKSSVFLQHQSTVNGTLRLPKSWIFCEHLNVIESKNPLIFTNCEMFNEIEIKTPWYYPVKRSLGQLNLKQDQQKLC